MKNKSLLVNLIGGPGTGKTTMAALIFAELKMRGHNAEYVSEYPKLLVWKKQFDLLKDQMHVARKQASLFKNLDGAVDFIITDGSLLHGLYYNRYKNHYIEKEVKQQIEDFILKKYRKFNNLNIFLSREDNPYIHVGRIETFKEALHVDKTLKYQLTFHNIPFVNFIAKKEKVIDIVEYIESKYNCKKQ